MNRIQNTTGQPVQSSSARGEQDEIGHPPPYNDSDDNIPQFVQQTTTTTITTTTTSFFPRMRRKTEGTNANSVTTFTQQTASGSLLVNKELPAIPKYKEGTSNKKQSRRPRTAESPGQRRDSVVAMSMPLALAHASMGLNMPPMGPRWSLDLTETDPVDRQLNNTTPKPRPQSPNHRSSRRSMSLTIDSAAFMSDAFSSPAPEVRLGGSLDYNSPVESGPPSTSKSTFWSHSSSPIQAQPRKSKTMHAFPRPQESTPTKQISRRPSWWGRRKAEPQAAPPANNDAITSNAVISPPHSAHSGKPHHAPRTASALSITPKAEHAQFVDTPTRPVVDLSQSPTFDDHSRPSQSAPLSPVLVDEPQQFASSSQVNLSKGEDALKPPASDLRRSSSSKRPRALSLFLKSNGDKETVSTSASPSPLAPSSTGAHARPRTANTPPLLRRFSSTLFSHSPYSSTSPTPDSSISLFTEAPSSIPAQPIPRPRIDEEETPEGYVQRLMEAVSKAEVAGVLAAKGDDFHAQALKIYLGRFSFKNDPLDIAVRRLLMDLALPRETQQIDRVMEAFASRYNECNTGLFAQADQAYILAFSLIMLHTDAFNKSNKNKMTKAAYVKNTRLPGVQPEVLDYFFDNIVFAPFIFIEDPMDINGQRGFSADSANSSSGFLSKTPKIDPYYLIASDLLDPLRLQVDKIIPPKSPYRYLGTAEAWNHEELRQAFAEASIVELGDKEFSRRLPASHGSFSGFTSTPPSIFPLTLSTHAGMTPAAFNDVWTFKLTKIGVINRKEDILDGGKKASARKWRQFKVALTGSQLLFFKDLKWDHQLVEKKGSPHVLTLPSATVVKPDEVISVNDAVALFDSTYTKYRNTFRLTLPQGRQYLMQVLDEHELNEWLARINYASAFRTAGLRMRPIGLSGRDVELTGIAAANSHVREAKLWKQQQHNGSTPNIRNWTSPDVENGDDGMEEGEDDNDHDTESSTDHAAEELAPVTRTLPFNRSNVALDVENAGVTVHEDAEQLKAAFEDVKKELAAVRQVKDQGSQPGPSRSRSIKSSTQKPSTLERMSYEIEMPRERLSSRGTVLQLKITELEKRITSLQAQLDADLRCARNFAILTPFQHSTRQRLQEHIPPLAKRIQGLRLEMMKLQCHKEVLYADFVGEERQRYQTTRAALKVATATLKRRLGEPASPDSSPTNLTRSKSKSSTRPPVAARSSQRRQNSFASSASSTHEGSLPTLVQQSTGETSKQGRASTSSRHQQEQTVMPNLDEPISAIDEAFPAPRKSFEQEQAEEWNKTKAAKRVSLVKVHRQSLRPLATRLHLDEALEHLAETPSTHSLATNPAP